MPREPIKSKIGVAPELPSQNEIEAKIRSLEKKAGIKRKAKPLPKAPSEKAPGEDNVLA